MLPCVDSLVQFRVFTQVSRTVQLTELQANQTSFLSFLFAVCLLFINYPFRQNAAEKRHRQPVITFGY